MQWALFCATFHNSNKQPQPQRILLWYSCSVTMINIAKKFLWKKMHQLNKHLDRNFWWFLASSKEWINCQKSPVAKLVLTAASTLSLSYAYNASVFSEINSVPPYFFCLKYFIWKGPLTVKIRKKLIDQILGYISFCFEICFFK